MGLQKVEHLDGQPCIEICLLASAEIKKYSSSQRHEAVVSGTLNGGILTYVSNISKDTAYVRESPDPKTVVLGCPST